MLIEYPEMGLEYQEFDVILPVNAKKKRGKQHILEVLNEIGRLLKSNGRTKIQWSYHFVFRARETKLQFKVCWINRRRWNQWQNDFVVISG